MEKKWVTVMGSFVADLAFRSAKLPKWGETVLGSDFLLGPGGKGSNQAVAAARLGGRVSFISQLGNDAFGDIARKTYRDEGIDTQFLFATKDHATGAASIVVDEVSGENAIVVVPGACFHLKPSDVDKACALISESAVFMTQLELAIETVEHGLRLAKSLNILTVFNPAPALPVPKSIYPLCDFVTPNESEAHGLTGIAVKSVADAEKAADAFLTLGVQNVVITLGAQGAFVKNRSMKKHVLAFDAGAVVETTGAGDAFNGGFAIALSEGMDIAEATRFGCAVAGISVTRTGTAPAMPHRDEVESLLRKNS